MGSELRTIGAVSRETGVHPSSLRRYEERGFVSPQRVRVGGRQFRVYSADDVELLREVKGLVDDGYTVRAAFAAKLAEYVGLSNRPAPNEHDSLRAKGGDINDELRDL